MSYANAQSESKDLGYLMLSCCFHAALVIAAAQLTENIREKVEATQIEFVALEQPEAPEPTPEPIAKSLPTKAPMMAPLKAAARTQAAPKVKAGPVVADSDFEKILDETSPVAVPILEEESLQAPTKIEAAELKADELNDDFAKVDQESAQHVALAQQQMAQENEQALIAQDQELNELKEQALADDQAMAKVLEQEALARAEKAKAAALAREQALAAQAAAAAAAASQQKAHAKQGGVRSLSELKQVPGNKRPVYASDDRLKGRQGEVAFLAYISNSGKPTQFKMLKSSGHRSLDLNTLKALKEWKFYPGQEGWVEIPFRWDLKGGPQEMYTTLRRKVSSRN